MVKYLVSLGRPVEKVTMPVLHSIFIVICIPTTISMWMHGHLHEMYSRKNNIFISLCVRITYNIWRMWIRILHDNTNSTQETQWLDYRIKIVLYLEKWTVYNALCGFPGGSGVKNLHAMQKTQIWSLGQEDPLEKEMVTYPSILAWEILWTEEPGKLQSMGSQNSWTWLSD